MTCIGLLGRSAEEAKKTNNSVGKTLAKVGLVLVAVTEIILFISGCIEYSTKAVSVIYYINRKTGNREDVELIYGRILKLTENLIVLMNMGWI